jgi:hypothetical protein
LIDMVVRRERILLQLLTVKYILDLSLICQNCFHPVRHYRNVRNVTRYGQIFVLDKITMCVLEIIICNHGIDIDIMDNTILYDQDYHI